METKKTHIQTRIIKSCHGYNSKYKIIMDDGRYNFAIVPYNSPTGSLYIKLPGIPAARLFYHLQDKKRWNIEYEDEFSINSGNITGRIHTKIKKLFLFEHRLTQIQYEKDQYHLYTVYSSNKTVHYCLYQCQEEEEILCGLMEKNSHACGEDEHYIMETDNIYHSLFMTIALLQQDVHSNHDQKNIFSFSRTISKDICGKYNPDYKECLSLETIQNPPANLSDIQLAEQITDSP